MNTQEILMLIRALSGMLELAQSANIDIQRYLEIKQRADDEGREINDDELLALRMDAENAIENASRA